MKKLLYVGHDFHNKTKSTQFLQNMFSNEYEVDVFSYDPYSDNEDKFKELKGKQYDILVVFQIMPAINLLKDNIKFKQAVYFPMYDGASSRQDSIWYDYKDFNIINFSRTLHEELLRLGLSSYYIQYFPEPKEVKNWGNEDSIFFWQRTNQISIKTVEILFDIQNVGHLHFHRAIDPGHTITEPSDVWEGKLSVSTWYDKKEDMQKDIEQAAIYIAPRITEGIGMSFLEAMAMGRCVVSSNAPTMNEYIEHNKTGILYDYKNPQHLNLNNIRKIQEQTLDYMWRGYEKWQIEKFQILDWIKAKPVIDEELLKKYFKIRSKCMKLLLKYGIIKEIRKSNSYRIKLCGIEIFKKKWR